MSIAVLAYLLLLLSVAFIGGVILKSVKQPPIVGYLLGGLVLGILVGNNVTHEAVQFLAQLGVVLLLFTLGLEFSPTKMGRVARIAVWGGLVQIALTIILGAAFIHLFGFNWFSALFMAAAFSLSSTAVVVKLLTDRGELDSLPGEILVGWSIVQDLMVLPMIIILPALGKAFAGNGWNWGSLGQSLGLTVGILIGVVYLGKKLVPYLVGRIAALNSRELLLVGIFSIAVAGALLTQLLGLSAALGAFLAGVLIAESSQEHAIFSEIRPLRDLFTLLFFTSLGVVLPAGFLFSYFLPIIGIATIIILIKLVVVTGLMLFFGYHAKTSLTVGFGLVNVGEFAFILAQVGVGYGIVSPQVYGVILSVAILSILFMPPLFSAVPFFYTKAREISKKNFAPVYARFFSQLEHGQTLPELPYADHVVVCGYGRVGKYIGRALSMAKIPFVVVEYNHHKAEKLKAEGIEVVYGDPADIDILDFAQVDKARAVVVAIPDLQTQQQVVTNSLSLNKNVHIYCRTHHEENQPLLKSLGATAVVQPEFEASLSITDKILRSFGQKPAVIEGKVSRLKIEHGVG